MKLKLLNLRRKFWQWLAEYCEEKGTQCYIDFLEERNRK